MSKPLEGRIALVTGATRGIGRAVALALGRAGAHVIATGRTTGGLEDVDDELFEATGERATLLKLDLRNGDMLDALGPTLHQRFGRLDVFIANAGMLGPLSPLAHVSADDWQRVIDVNLNANWRLVRTLDPLLRLSASGRAVFVTSGAASGKAAYWGPYAVSKAGVDALARTYAQEVASTSVRVNLVSPGPVATQMRAKAFPGEDPATLVTPEQLAPLFVELASAAETRHGETLSGQRYVRG